MTKPVDIAIVGSGFAGTILAMVCRRLGRSVVLIERGRHPRFAIGESSTPLTNLLLEEIASTYDLAVLRPFTKWGPWQRERPTIACGLKRGFTFHHHEFGRPFIRQADRANQLMVAASPHDEIADTHWYRPDFDAFLAQEAEALGAAYFDEAFLDQAEFTADGARLSGTRHGRPLEVTARFVVDATGPRGFLHRALRLPEGSIDPLPHTEAVYSHFTGVQRLDQLTPENSEMPPYPPDDAALHHVFDGGWIWVLRFNNGLVSAGVVATQTVARRFNFASGAAAWKAVLDQLPEVRTQFAGAQATLPFVHMPRVAFRSAVANGPRWALLPSAAGSIDPLLSTGFPLTLLGVRRLAGLLSIDDWSGPAFRTGLDDYARRTLSELDATRHLVAALYASMRDPEQFSALTLLYFAAASFTETARRLGKPALAGTEFLLGERRGFAEAVRDCCERAFALQKSPDPNGRTELLTLIRRAIEPVNIAGLDRPDRCNWHPVDADDLYSARDKLGATRGEIDDLLTRCGFFAKLK